MELGVGLLAAAAAGALAGGGLTYVLEGAAEVLGWVFDRTMVVVDKVCGR